MKYALKEWNTTIEALSKGQIIAVWRKGGIDDEPGIRKSSESFTVEQKQFILFPTFTHQNYEKIKKEFWFLFDGNKGPNKDNQIKIKYWAELGEELSVDSPEQLLAVSNELVNSNEYLMSSWDLYPNHKGKLLLLRVYILSNPILIPNSPEYAGCKSWIELKIDVPRVGSKAVLSFKDFSRKSRFIKSLLEQTKSQEAIA